MRKKATPQKAPLLETHKAAWRGFGGALLAAIARVWELITENVQGLVAGTLAVILFAATPYIIAGIWPDVADAGIASPAGYLHALSLAAVIFFVGIFAAWIAYQIDWKGFDARIGLKDVLAMVDAITNPALKLCVLLSPFFLLLAWFGFSCWLAVLLLQ